MIEEKHKLEDSIVISIYVSDKANNGNIPYNVSAYLFVLALSVG